MTEPSDSNPVLPALVDVIDDELYVRIAVKDHFGGSRRRCGQLSSGSGRLSGAFGVV